VVSTDDAPEREQKRPRITGLKAISQAREERSGGRYRWTTQAGITVGAVAICGFIAHHVLSARELNKGKEELLAKQRATEETLGKSWYPLRDKLEARIHEAAKDFKGDFVDPGAPSYRFRDQPGLYLRLRAAEVKDAQSIRKNAGDAKKDAFAGCLLREPNQAGVKGEIDGGAFSEQPWNLGQAYRSTRVLTDEFVKDVKEADQELRLRALKHQFEEADKKEIPQAVSIVKGAQFFLLVLDEDVPEAAAKSDAGITSEALQLVAHPVRIHLFDLKTDKEMLRLRRSATGTFLSAGERPVTDPAMQEAMQRQVNNCTLAKRVEIALWPPDAGAP
jgi:hypothetical protein